MTAAALPALATSYDVDGGPRATSRCCRGRSAVTRWSTSTTPPARTSRARCSTPSAQFVEQHYSNVHRGVHTLSQEATDAYEAARATVAAFLGAPPARGRVHQERHRGLQPRRLLASATPRRARGSRSAPATRSASPRWSTTPTSCRGRCSAERTGATLRWIPLTDDGRLDLTDLDSWSTSAPRCRVRARQQHPRHRQPGRRAGRAGPARSGPSPCSTARSRRRTSRSTWPRSGSTSSSLTGHKMLAPVGHRRPVGPPRAARRDAAVPGRRLDDRGRRR